MTPPFISLERVRALGVVVAWHEGIAIAQRCAEQIPPAGARAGLDTCAISATGAVRVGGVSTEPFRRDALLSLATALVDTENAPPQLAEALARAGETNSLTREDLMRELAFFSRPDAVTAIAAVAARTLAKEAEASAQGELERLRAEASAAPRKAAPVQRQRPTQRIWMAAGGLGVIVATGAAAWTMPWPSAMVSPVASVLAESSPLTAVTEGIDRLVERGLKTLGAAATEPPAVENPAPPPASSSTRRRDIGAVAAMAPRVSIERRDPAPAADVDAASHTEPGVEVFAADDALPVDTGVYSLQDQEIEPPTLAHPQLPSALSATDHAGGSYLELLVSESGTVERARLHAAHSTLHERMLVSAAKAWRFRPALKEGRPVKYITRIAVSR